MDYQTRANAYTKSFSFVVESAPQPEGRISPVDLYKYLNDKDMSLIIMDVRPGSQYDESHIKHEACISVPAEIIKPGYTDR
jgi:hypothetical protein